MTLLSWILALSVVPRLAGDLPMLPEFRGQEIETTLGVGYAVLLADLNGDGKKDIIVVDTQRVLWYENPTWKRRIITQGQTRPDNVCIDAADIDGDGQLDLALGADWRPFNTQSGGTLQWLRRGATLDEPWTLHPISDDIPAIHRLRFADVDGDGRPELIVAPLMGRGSTAAKNWSESPVDLHYYKIPAQPTRDRWIPETIDHKTLHVVHNFHPVPTPRGLQLLTASYEGVQRFTRATNGEWTAEHVGMGNQSQPERNRGASEVKQGRHKDGSAVIATIEPWHGHQVVVYTPSVQGRPWTRTVVDEELKWGHAVAWADLDGDGGDELIIGVRDHLNDQARCGVRVYRWEQEQWRRHKVDAGGVAVEDLAVADLDGDGRPDLVAVGRATHNIRIYWNRPGR